MQTIIYINSEAEKLLTDEKFLAQWKLLYAKCGWATFFQSIEFVSTWYEFYQANFDLIFVCGFDESNNLIGFFPLTQEQKTKRICVAGCYLAEYQTWLVTEKDNDVFIENALQLLSETFPHNKLEFPFIAPKTPLTFFETDKKWSEQSELRSHPRPLIEVGDGSKANESLQKKGNKTRLRQLNKIGKVEIETIETPEEFAKVFDEIETLSQFRMSALHNVLPISDSQRKPFHLALMKIPNLFYISLLKVGEKIASAKICLKNNGEMLQSITAMSPFLANQSPSKIHTYLLWNELAEKNIEIFDLSPGGGYKERFATHSENVFSLTLFFDKQDFLRYKYKRKIIAFGKETLEKARVGRTKAFAIADKIHHKLQRVKRRTIPKTIWKNVRRKIYELKEVRVYKMDSEKIRDLPKFNLMKRDCIEDLLKYEPVEGWQFTVSEFHQVCHKRFESGNHSYTLAENNKLLHYGWLVEKQEISNVYEVKQELKLPPNSSVLFDFFTHPESRGKGFYNNSMCQILHDTIQNNETKQVYICVLADNLTSRSVIEKLGFNYQGSLFHETKFAKVKKWQFWQE